MSIIEHVASRLELNSQGVWISRRSSSISYSVEGNARCFELEYQSFWFRHRNGVIAEVLKAYPPQGQILDIGGGNGYVAAGLHAAGFETVVLEPGPQGALHAKQRGIDHVICATLDDLELPEQSVAARAMFDVLEHIKEDAQTLELAWRCLKPGGSLYISVPTYNWLWSEEDVEAGHFRRYTCRRLRRDLQAAGFTVPFCSYFFWFLPAPILLFRTLPSLFWRRGRKIEDEEIRSHQPAPAWLQPFLNSERARFARGKRMPFGSSCIAVARRPAAP